MRYFLAPLAGFTDAPFRLLCREGGADVCFTEMVSAAGLSRDSAPTWRLLETMEGEGAVALQIFGAKESEVAASARMIADAVESGRCAKFTELNLNAGCPVQKVVREGAGAKLVGNPQKIYLLLKAMKENCGLPVTLKTRLGPHPAATTIFEIADASEKAGASAIAVHARYTSQMHGGPVHLDVLAELVGRSRIPVVGNGSVTDAKSAAEMARTGVSAIMIGRAALSDPYIFSRLKEGASASSAGADDRRRFFERHLDLLLRYRDMLERKYPGDHIPSADAFASVKMHTHLFRYFNGRPGAAELRRRLNNVRTLAEIREIAESL